MRGKKRTDFVTKRLSHIPVNGYFSIRVYDDVRSFTVYQIIDRVTSKYCDIVVARAVTGIKSRSDLYYLFDSQKLVLHNLEYVPNP